MGHPVDAEIDARLRNERRGEDNQIRDNDPVNHPSHYTYGPFEVIDVIEGFKLNFHLGNVVKYILRHEHKGGIEDLKKARWYLNRLIEKLEEGCDASG